MIADYNTAIEEIYNEFYTTWIAQSSAVVGYVPEIRVEGVELPDEPDYSKFWCRFSTQEVRSNQTTLKGDEKIRYRNYGLVFIQIFCPKSGVTSARDGRDLSDIGKKSYQGHSTSGKIWFRNTRVNGLTPENLWYRINVISEYQYDTQGD